MRNAKAGIAPVRRNVGRKGDYMKKNTSDRDTGGPVTATETTPQTGPNSPAAPPPTPGAPARFKAIDVFHTCIDRSQNLLKIHKRAHGKRSKPEKYLADAHRAAVVLAVSALDAYVRTVVIERIRTLLLEKKQLPQSLSCKIKIFLKEDGLLEAARQTDLLDRVEKALSSDFERRSFQGAKVIEEYLELSGLPNVFARIAKNIDVNEQLLVEQLDSFTQRRHVIAHRGDLDLTKNPPAENDITMPDATDCIKLMQRIAGAIDRIGV